MKLRVMSDLHLEFNPFETVELDEDVVILAGDISPMRYMNVPTWARRNWPTKDILWVLGNHEHYATGWTIEEGVEHARTQAAEQEVVLHEPQGEPGPWGAARRVHVLEEGVVYSPWGVRFLGCTLWTDFKFRGDERDGMAWASHIMADFRGQITAHNKEGRFSAEASRKIHDRQVCWLGQELAKPYDGKTVVITHHVPHPGGNHPAHAKSSLSPAFVSDLSALIEKWHPDVWVSGHTHASYRFNVGKTLLVSNQRGYSDVAEHPDAPFDPNLIIEV